MRSVNVFFLVLLLAAAAAGSCISASAGAPGISTARRGSIVVTASGSLQFAPVTNMTAAYGTLLSATGPFLAVASTMGVNTPESACALMENGTVFCACPSGTRCPSVLSVPSPNSGFDAISASPLGNTWFARRKESGALVGWGLLAPSDTTCYACTVPSPNSGWGDFHSGYGHACAIRAATGSIQCWGTATCDNTLTLPSDNRGFVQVALGACFSCYLRSNGTVWCTGSYAVADSIPDNRNWAYISAGYTHICGVRKNGTVSCWGFEDGATALPQNNSGFVTVSLGQGIACGVRKDSSVECWGVSSNGTFSSNITVSAPPLRCPANSTPEVDNSPAFCSYCGSAGSCNKTTDSLCKCNCLCSNGTTMKSGVCVVSYIEASEAVAASGWSSQRISDSSAGTEDTDQHSSSHAAVSSASVHISSFRNPASDSHDNHDVSTSDSKDVQSSNEVINRGNQNKSSKTTAFAVGFTVPLSACLIAVIAAFAHRYRSKKNKKPTTEGVAIRDRLEYDLAHSPPVSETMQDLRAICKIGGPEDEEPIHRILSINASFTSKAVQLEGKELRDFQRSFPCYYQMHHKEYNENRILKGLPPITFVAKRVWRIENPLLESWYSMRRQYMQKVLGRVDEELEERIGFHGTDPDNIKNICDKGLLRVKHPLNPSTNTDSGFFGHPEKGVYVSRYVEYALQYSNLYEAPDGTRMLCALTEGDSVKVVMLKVLPGRVKHVEKITLGMQPTPGFDSHSSPEWCEWYLFDETQVLPSWIVEIQAAVNTRTCADDGKDNIVEDRMEGGNMV